MKALLHHFYGSPDVLELADVAKPDIGEDDVLIRLHAAAVNPLDWHLSSHLGRLRAETRGWRPQWVRS